METVKVFTNGGSQAILLPKSIRFNCDEVGIQKIGNIVMLFDRSSALQDFIDSEPLGDSIVQKIIDSEKRILKA